MGLARQLAAGPTLAYTESKRLLASAAPNTLAFMQGEEAAAQTRCGSTNDHADAVVSFLAKNPPTFRGQ
jgi:2-(1,2-epoxy-1,2-dihydrophenyl)acetyl-CoA isomerase